MKILFIHQNFPGQYLPLARHLGAKGDHEIVFITQRKDAELPGVRKVVYEPKRKVTPGVHHYLREAESHVLNGQEVARVAMTLRDSGFTPDVILGHNGWGEIWYLKDIFRNTPLIGYFEFYYRFDGADVGFEPGVPVDFDTGPRVRTKNIGNLLGLDTADLGQCATHWQRSVYPACYQSKLHVVHEGVDTNIVVPNAKARLKVPNSDLELSAGDEVVTYVARNLEPYRGFPSFMRSLPAVLEQRPRAHILIVGADGVSYGASLPEGKTFKQELLNELGGSLDLSRVHFLGKVPYSFFLGILQISRVHVYLTYPFVLSWSMIEAMSAGCLLVASRTPPVQEVIREGENGILVDLFSPQEIAERVVEALADRTAHDRIRADARRTAVEQFDQATICLPAQLRLMRLAAPPPKASLWSARSA
jgi:glycosyltransferase involved in cell wall biosynthesis